jgi:type IV pilus assembly protein PilV
MGTRTSLKYQSGMLLIEGLIAILVFTIGVLGVVGLQATVVKQVTDAKFRTDASMLANQLLGTMWVSDRTTGTLQTNFNTGGASYNAWLAQVTATLPGAAANPPTVAVSNQGVATVTIRWLAPSEAAGTAPHRYIVIAQIQ